MPSQVSKQILQYWLQENARLLEKALQTQNYMTDLIKHLSDQKEKEQKELERLNALHFDCKVRIKAIEKAIKALQNETNGKGN